MRATRIEILIVALAALLLPSTSALAQRVVGNCTTTATAFAVVQTTAADIENQSFENLAGATVPFTQGSRGCVVVMFSAESFAEINESLQLKPTLSGAGASSPATLMFAANDPGLYTTRTAIFVFPNVSPGPHTLRMQVRSAGGDRTELRNYTLLVQFAR